MKRVIFYIFAILGSLFAPDVIAQTFTCTGPGSGSIAGTSLKYDCGSAPQPPVTPPPITPPATGCSELQLSTAIGGKTLKRQCTPGMTVWPSGASGSGDGTDLAKAIGGGWPNYQYSGYTPTWSVRSGYYVALAFTPTSTGTIQLSANQSYGDGGTISLSTVPGALTKGAAGVICALNRGGSNSLYVSTAAGSACQVQTGTTYWINFADVDASGNARCYAGTSTTCSESKIAYTLYTSAQ